MGKKIPCPESFAGVPVACGLTFRFLQPDLHPYDPSLCSTRPWPPAAPLLSGQPHDASTSLPCSARMVFSLLVAPALALVELPRAALLPAMVLVCVSASFCQCGTRLPPSLVPGAIFLFSKKRKQLDLGPSPSTSSRSYFMTFT